MGRRGITALCLSAGLVLAGLSAPAGGEVFQKQGVRVTIDGGLTPHALPRHGRVPVAVSVSGRIAATKQNTLPQLKALTIAINSAGALDVGGIPHCRINHINPSTSQQALAMCRSSLIGSGHFSANVLLPEQSPFPSEGRLLAFNGRIGRRPAIFAHVYGTRPLATSYVFAFRIHRRRGTFGTVLKASFPRATGDWGYITGISLNLDKSRFMQAGCPAPAGFNEAVFPLVKTSFDFAGGLDIQSTLTRSCEAKG